MVIVTANVYGCAVCANIACAVLLGYVMVVVFLNFFVYFIGKNIKGNLTCAHVEIMGKAVCLAVFLGLALNPNTEHGGSLYAVYGLNACGGIHNRRNVNVFAVGADLVFIMAEIVAIQI